MSKRAQGVFTPNSYGPTPAQQEEFDRLREQEATAQQVLAGSDEDLMNTPMGAGIIQTPVQALGEDMAEGVPPIPARLNPTEGGTVVEPNDPSAPTAEQLAGEFVPVKTTGRYRLSDIAPETDPYDVPVFDPNESVYAADGRKLGVAEAEAKFNEEQMYQQSRLNDRDVSYDQITPEQNTEAYKQQKENGPAELSSIYTLGHNLAESVSNLTIDVNLTTANSNIGDGTDPQAILANEFNASPLNVVNAATESIAQILLSLGQGKLRGKGKQEAIDKALNIDTLDNYMDNNVHDIFGGEAEEHQIGIQVDAFHGLLYSLTERKLRTANGTASPKGTLGIGGQMLAKALEDAGYIVKDDYQPVHIDTGVEKGPKVKAYMLTAKGMTAGKSLWKFRSSKIQRQGAQGTSGNIMRSVGVLRTGANKAITDRAGQVENDLGTQLMEGWGRHAANATKIMDTDITDMSSTMLASLNGEQESQGPDENPDSFVSRLRLLSQKILNVNQTTEEVVPKFGADVETVQLPISETQKFKKVLNDVKNANELQARLETHKTPVFQDPTTGRTYYMTYDSNGQESRVHRSAVRGIASNVDMTMMPERLNNTEMTTGNQRAAYETWLKGNGQPNAASRYVSYMIAMGNLLVRGSRDYNNLDTLQKLTGDVIRDAAQKGRSLRKFLVLNGETQNEIMKDLKRGVRVEGLTPDEQGDILYVMETILETGNEKEFGAQMRGYLVAAKLEEAHSKGLSSTFISLPTAADMKSAGRMFAAMDTMDVDTISRVGLALDEVAGSSPLGGSREIANAFPVGNPRMFYTDSLKNLLRDGVNHPKGGDTDIGGVNFSPEFSYDVSIYLDQMLSKQGPTFSDMVAKLSLMVADYGKAVSQNSEEVAIFLKKAKGRHPEIFGDMEKAFTKQGFGLQAVNQFFEEAMWQTTKQIVKSGNSSNVKKTAQAMALFNIQPYYIGVRGMRVRVGKNVHEMLPDNSVVLQNIHTQEIINLRSGYAVDDPLRATTPKMLENGQTYYTPGIASAAVNAMGPAMGHARETAAMAIAFQMVVDRLGEGIFMDQVYDSITLEPEAAMLYEYYLNEVAIFEVFDVNDNVQLHKAFSESVMAELRDIRSKGTVTVGDQGQYSGWTTKLDEEWASLIKPKDESVIKNAAFRKQSESIEGAMVERLYAAQEAGLWRPLHNGVITVKGRKFIPRPASAKVWSVDGSQFALWFVKYIKSDIDKVSASLYRSNRSVERKKFRQMLKEVYAKGFQTGGLIA